MNQMLQDPQTETSQPTKAPPPVPQDPATEHPRFAKPQRVAFVQACWHREVVQEARTAFLAEMEARMHEKGGIRPCAWCGARDGDKIQHFCRCQKLQRWRVEVVK